MNSTERNIRYIRDNIFGLLDAYNSIGATVIAMLRPEVKGSLFNQAVTANTNFFSENIVPTVPPCIIRIYACFDTEGILSVVKRVGETEVVMHLNSGNTLNANCLYAFDIFVGENEEINFRYSVNATALDVKVFEIGASIS